MEPWYLRLHVPVAQWPVLDLVPVRLLLPAYQTLPLNFVLMWRLAGANAQRLPLLRVFQAMLDAVTVVQLIEAFGLNEHLVAVEHACDAGLAWLHALVLAELAGLRVVRSVRFGLFVG